MSIDITMPRLSDTMETGTIIKWDVAVGDTVSAGAVVADIETDKATMEMQVFDDGIIAQILVPEGQTCDVGTVIAVLAEEDEDPSSLVSPTAVKPASEAPPAPATAERTAPLAEPPAAALVETPPRPEGRMRVSPVARRLADEHNLDLSRIHGSGPGGRIIKRDVRQALETGQETAAAVPPTTAPVEAAPIAIAAPIESPAIRVVPAIVTGPTIQEQLVPVSNMRQTIARRLVESKTTVPHYQVTVTFDMDPLLDMRAHLNEQLAVQQVKLSVNDFLVRCCALAMYEHPYFNASWTDEGIRIHGAINIGMAISIPPERGGGLVVGVIPNADQKSLRSISAESKFLAEKARTRGLSLEEMSDSTFTLSNLGMFGVDHFTAIINPPNSAILAVGAAIQKPVVRNGELTVGRVMSATLSSDHRVIDGAMAAQYLRSLKQLLENPAALLV